MRGSMIVLFLGVHITICLTAGYKLYKNQIRTRAPVLPVVVLIPVFGVLLLLAHLWLEENQKNGSRKIELEKLEISDMKFRPITVEGEEKSEMIVPLEEAIAINDAGTRRTLMLDILHRNPDEHVALLQRARLADDTELTHYATTTMMEIQSGYEQRIRELEQESELCKGINDTEGLQIALRKLRKELKRYIESGLITGNILNIYRRKLEEVLRQLLAAAPENKNYYLDSIENRIGQRQTEHLEADLKKALHRWPQEEYIYRLLVQFYQLTAQGEKIKEILTEMEEKKIYLSAEGKRWFAFWKHEREK